ncbi:MAG: 50S ribosomal protein L15 [Alphaproteobacteria bacterium]|nr:50S ribosomal protein L15 [Rickettsiales bacterium]
MSILKLNELDKVVRNRKRVGRGYSSGKGKTCGRGHKGQKSRSGARPASMFRKTGQTPLYRRIPHRGFSSLAQIRGRVPMGLSIEIIVSLIDKGTIKDNITKSDLVSVGLMKSVKRKVKLLGGEKVCKKFTIEVDAVSVEAKKRLENKGGKVLIVGSGK